jgi:hypothetical protein
MKGKESWNRRGLYSRTSTCDNPRAFSLILEKLLPITSACSDLRHLESLASHSAPRVPPLLWANRCIRCGVDLIGCSSLIEPLYVARLVENHENSDQV